MKYILLVYFDDTVESEPDFLESQSPKTFFDLRLYKIDGIPVYRWAIDYETDDDERCVAFGPYASKEKARIEFEHLPVIYTLGYRLYTEEAFQNWFEENEEYFIPYTDG